MGGDPVNLNDYDFAHLSDADCEALMTRLEDYVTSCAVNAVKDRNKIERRLYTWTDLEIQDVQDDGTVA